MNTYYIVFEHQVEHMQIQSWRIRNTPHDMNTSKGLQALIKELEEETGNGVVITYWRELDV